MAIDPRFTEVELKSLGKDLTAQIQDYERAYDVRRRIAMEHYKNYNSIVAKRFYNGRSDIFVPLSFQIVESLLAKVMRAIFNEPNPVFLEGTGASDKAQEEKIRALLHMQQKKNVRLWLKIQDYWRSKLMYGRGYGKMVWRTEQRKIRKPKMGVNTPEPEIAIDPETGEEIVLNPAATSKVITLGSEEKLVNTYDCWDCIPIDWFDMLVDPLAPDGDIQRARFVGQRLMLHQDDLVLGSGMLDAEGKPRYTNFEDLLGKGNGRTPDDVLERKHAVGIEADEKDKDKQDGKKHLGYEVYFHRDMDGDGIDEEYVATVLCEEERVIQVEANPWWHQRKPFFSSSMFRRPNEFLGQGVLDPIRRMQYEVNDKRNQSLDYASMSLNAIWLVGDGAGIEENQIRVTQNGVVHANDISQIRQIAFPDLTGVGTQAELILDSNMREATGATRSVQGLQEGGPRQTATQFSQLLAQAGDRLRLALESYGHEAWVPMWEMAHALNQQYLRKNQYVRLTEKDATGLKIFGTEGDVSPEDVMTDVNFIIPSFGDVEAMNLRNQNLLTMLQVMQSIPPAEDNVTFMNILLRKIWVDLFKFEKDELFITDPETGEGRDLVIVQPGAQSAFDEAAEAERQAASGGGTPAAQQEPAGDVQSDIDALANELGAAQQSVPTGGINA